MSERQFLTTFEDEFRKAKRYADEAVAQLEDAALHQKINPLQNSIAVVVRHVSGNLASRFTDLLISDGEKPSRDRDSEFDEGELSRAELMAIWEKGWNCLFQSLASLEDDDLGRIVHIRNEPHTVLKALVRSSAHCSWHAAQIALIAKHLKGEDWKYLTIPPKGSKAFNQKMGMATNRETR